ncbi:MAG: hypothetical protein GEV03_12790 [Streptosporangiales bacterium]|nr:hypothetical protein [Streptosporangiales bacterium]
MLRASQPVIDCLIERLHGTPTSVLLTDGGARILRRDVAEFDLRRRLDSVNAERGFYYLEEYTGTNGLGTAVEERRPVQITGPEHFCGPLEQFTCAGVPIFHPLTGHLEGVIDVTCRFLDTNERLLPIAVEAAAEIEERLFLQCTRREQALLRAFLRASKGARSGIVALNDQVLLSNALAARILNQTDQTALWEYAVHAIKAGRDKALTLTLGDLEVNTAFHPMREGDEVVGALVEIDLPRRPTAAERSRSQEVAGAPLRRAVGGLVGESASWIRLCGLASWYASRGLPLLLLGERGVGKLALAKGLHADFGDPGEPTVIEGAMSAGEDNARWLGRVRRRLAQPRGTLIVTHVELLPAAVVEALAGLLAGTPADRRPFVVATAVETPDQPETEHRYDLLAQHAGLARIELPPLRERLEDIRPLAQHFLERHAPRPTMRFSPEAVQALGRLNWSGNARELETLAQQLAATVPGAVIELDDLPQDVRARLPRRSLTRFEQSELHAILGALRETGGNKKEAARHLGLARSTLYRKLRALGIDQTRLLF